MKIWLTHLAQLSTWRKISLVLFSFTVGTALLTRAAHLVDNNLPIGFLLGITIFFAFLFFLVFIIGSIKAK